MYDPAICLEGPKKNHKKLQSGQLVSKLSSGPPEYKAVVY
jgi:hypothetical protein